MKWTTPVTCTKNSAILWLKDSIISLYLIIHTFKSILLVDHSAGLLCSSGKLFPIPSMPNINMYATTRLPLFSHTQPRIYICRNGNILSLSPFRNSIPTVLVRISTTAPCLFLHAILQLDANSANSAFFSYILPSISPNFADSFIRQIIWTVFLWSAGDEEMKFHIPFSSIQQQSHAFCCILEAALVGLSLSKYRAVIRIDIESARRRFRVFISSFPRMSYYFHNNKPRPPVRILESNPNSGSKQTINDRQITIQSNPLPKSFLCATEATNCKPFE